ncbi:hypothetical protein FA13DRAFT_1291018 [Coprinellus micaceus]|uniref:Uncharacterized protein n=1 Tax=Coprinellus micaceus TaxID=71717 RepID=A0A4Y7R6W5_COPMI|nr:hypothetical protein FA13DRAFT_1291018 [Coprinellus micaceus]
MHSLGVLSVPQQDLDTMPNLSARCCTHCCSGLTSLTPILYHLGYSSHLHPRAVQCDDSLHCHFHPTTYQTHKMSYKSAPVHPVDIITYRHKEKLVYVKPADSYEVKDNAHHW